ncbi:LacI family transcriptional regulator [Jiangella aurantiaca]|uniref:LacI family transcriptional regulator n=1 Tax=Jiangella aurantiaca TaxID=2530373 RepID=A0A4R5A6A1_9ACTN|nr:LacI family transcriptional regulator [Jiangella aurantiaca]
MARAAGVSQGAVSAVIGGRSAEQRIPRETAQRIMDAARELGYVANTAARSLKGKRNRLLGVHTFESVFPISQRDFYHEFLIGIEEQAVAVGYDLVLFTSTEDPTGQRRVYRDGANRLNVADGSVLLGIGSNNSDLARLAADGYPFVHVGRRDVPDTEIAWVGADYSSATAELVGRLTTLGHRQVSYVGYAERYEASRDREAGYRSGCASNGITPGVAYLEQDDVTAQWLDRSLATGVTAFLVERQEVAMRIAEYSAARGLSIPDDLSIALIGASGGSSASRRWSTLGIPRNQMGREAVRLLVDMLTAPDVPREFQILLPCTAPDDSTIAAAPPRR